jgi:RNA polymerase sigma-70 factor (ECF subfamily)
MDQNLIQRAKNRDKDAFTTIVLQYGDRLYAVAFRILRDSARAEDAVQQAFLNAWRELPRLRDDGRFEAWLYTLLVNGCRAELRHVVRWQPGLHLVRDDQSPIDDAQLSIAMRDELERAFQRLSIEHRVVLVLHHYLGLTGDEIGRALDIAPGTVRSRLHHARQHMRGALEADARQTAAGGSV